MSELTWNHPQIHNLIDLALAEDLGTGDVTTDACIPEDQEGLGSFLARESLVVAGTPLLHLLFSSEEIDIVHHDGNAIEPDTKFAHVYCSIRKMLKLERTTLNLLQRTCGIATETRRYVAKLKGTGCTLLDTRKTSPGMRLIEKFSVRAGGGQNHRMGLYDAVLIKNNHITAAGGVQQALELFRNRKLPVEIEVRDSEQLEEALSAGSQHILLDNYTPEQVAQAVRHIQGRAKVEVSGNIRLETIRSYAEAGADHISVGALTHSAPAVDISFRISQR